MRHVDGETGTTLARASAMDLDFRPVGRVREPVPDSLNVLSSRVIGCAIEVHRQLGPGLLESTYDRALCIELAKEGLKFLRQLSCPLLFRGASVGEFRLDLLVEDAIVVEIKSVERFDFVFVSQMLTYLKATDKRLGLILNFNSTTLRSGIKRVVR